jgi:lipopolysaccharide transport system permease protein
VSLPATATPAAPERPWWAVIPGALMLRGVWQYRGFVLGMIAREFHARYLQSLLGSMWAIATPAATIAIYTVIFAQIMRARLPGVDDTFAYSIYLCAGILPWIYFTEVLTRSLTVFIDNAALLKKVSFPRATLPVILLAGSTIHFAITFGLFLLFVVALGRFPGSAVLALLPLLALQQAFALGCGVLLGCVNVFFRDVGQVVAVGLQFWFWLTPIVYSATILSADARAMLGWNPMTTLVGAYQQIMVSGAWPAWGDFRWHVLGAGLVLAAAFLAFDRLAGEIVDEL